MDVREKALVHASRRRRRSPLQGRRAFGTYLQRIQSRLLLDSQLKEEVTSVQHMELVIRFLKRAGLNLTPVFRVQIPSRRLVLTDQKRILAKQLSDFLHLYQKETMMNYEHLPLSNKEIDEHLFETFLRSASEADLEQVMTDYMKSNAHSAVHLGVQPRRSQSSSSGHVGQQPTASSDISGVDQQSNLIDHQLVNGKGRIHSCKPLVRSFSAFKQRALPEKKHEQIYRLDGLDRSLSTVVQQRKSAFSTVLLSAFTTFTRRSLLILDVNQDFVEQLNELSSKQHRRQYSGVHHLNVMATGSSPMDHRENDADDVSVDPTVTQRATRKEEEILEKSRQMIEQSDAKNELLAEQVSCHSLSLSPSSCVSSCQGQGLRRDTATK